MAGAPVYRVGTVRGWTLTGILHIQTGCVTLARSGEEPTPATAGRLHYLGQAGGTMLLYRAAGTKEESGPIWLPSSNFIVRGVAGPDCRA